MAKKNEAPQVTRESASTQEQVAVPNEELGTTAVMPAQDTSVAVQEPSLDDLFLEDAGLGLENIGAGDFSIPFIQILQKNSPQVSRANAKFIPGAAAGMLMNTVSQALMSGEDGIRGLYCGYDAALVEWISRDEGGGFVAHHKPGSAILNGTTKDARGRVIIPENGHLLVDTAYHYFMLLNEDAPPEWAVIAMSSTQKKASRQWNTTARSILLPRPNGGYFNPPTYSHIYQLTTIGQTKDTYDWFGWRIENMGRLTDPNIFRMAREFAEQIAEGKVRMSAPQMDADIEAPPSGDVPF